MAAMRTDRSSSFSRTTLASAASSASLPPPGVKLNSGSAGFISSGIPDLDRILAGGFLLGTVVMVMEDAEAPHHLLLLRNFMAQGIVHGQPLLFASPIEEPRAFLGTLPAPVVAAREERQRVSEQVQDGHEQGLRIAWQYKKYFGGKQASEFHSGGSEFGHLKDVIEACFLSVRGNSKTILCWHVPKACKECEFSSNFDLRKSMERHLLSSPNIECASLLKFSNLTPLRDHCSSFLSKLSGNDGGVGFAGRIAIQSLCAPQCGYSDWDMVSFIRSLKAMVQFSKSVAVLTFPSSILLPSFSKRWQHLADTLISVTAIPDDDQDLAKLLTGYQDMVGLLHVHKVAQISSQVPVILEASTFSLKLHRRRLLVLERLTQAPAEGSSGASYGTAGSCSGSAKGSSSIDF